MQEPTDDQLDGLFRKSAEEFDPPFDPTAWQDMQARLDTDGVTTPAGSSVVWKNILRWGLPVLLLLLGSVWYVNRDDKSHSDVSPAKSIVVQRQRLRSAEAVASENTVPSTPSADALTNTATPGVEEGVSAEKRPVSTPSSGSVAAVGVTKETAAPTGVTTANVEERSEPKRRTGANDKTKNREVATEAVASAYGAVKVPGLRPAIALPTNRSARKTSLQSESLMNPDFSSATYARNGLKPFSKRHVTNGTGQSPADGREADEMDEVAKTGLEKNNEQERLLLPMLRELPGRPMHWSKPTMVPSRVVALPTDQVLSLVQPQPAPPRGLSVRLLVAPDLSAVGLRNFSRPGTNVGLLLEYRLGRRWSVQTGVIQSTKIYKALPGEYGYLPETLERYKANLAEVSGRCNMLDIPINVRYDVLVKPRKDGIQPSRGFISGGVTNYIMNREDYSYTYYHYYPSNTTSWSTSTGGYGLSNLNLSIGYERAFGRRLSWQVEPFMKVPVRRVGYFKIDLLSTGAFFSVRYKL